MKVFATLTALLTVLCAAPPAGAQDWAKKKLEASGRHQEWVSVKHGDRTLKCFVVYPESKGKATVVVLIHEIMGLTDWVMSVADELAAEGFIAIAPDFLSGMGPGGGRSDAFEDVGKAREAVSGLPAAQVRADLDAAVEYGKTLDSSNGKAAVAGFCWGGSRSFQYATERQDLGAAFVFYGTGPRDEKSVEAIKAPVYGFYGGNDNRVTSTVEESSSLMKAAGKTYSSDVYEGAGHGFMRSGQQPDAQEANKKARDAAWAKMLQILRAL
ncbi:MAG: dienelactone hydrolase family protein [Armatimonadetes bacterium]|nr:dienelactone hydrolase family protein [Armatimonadota bacterium]